MSDPNKYQGQTTEDTGDGGSKTVPGNTGDDVNSGSNAGETVPADSSDDADAEQ